MFGLLKNKLYRLHQWLDNHEPTKFIVMIVTVAIPNVVIMLSNPLIGVSMYVILFPFFLSRYFFITGVLKFDRTLYDIPVVGELISVEKDFYFDGGFLKFLNPTDPSIKPSTIKINRFRVAEVIDVVEVSGDWDIFLKFSNESIVIPYFESRKYWITKSNVRNEKLRKIGI